MLLVAGVFALSLAAFQDEARAEEVGQLGLWRLDYCGEGKQEFAAC